QLLICDMIERLKFDYIASTGALMAHGLIEGIGDDHYKYDPRHSDKILAAQKVNRVTDTLEPEENFDHLDEVINAVLSEYKDGQVLSGHQFHHDIGAYLKRHYPKCRGVL